MRRTVSIGLVAAALAIGAPAMSTTAASASPDGYKPPPGLRWVGEIIRKDFMPLGKANFHTAMCVADRESNFDPKAYNPNSGASGVFQFIPSTWTVLSEEAGYGGDSPFKARPNIGTAAWAVSQPDIGWGPWGGHCP